MEIYMYVYILPIKFENSPHPHSIHDCPAVTKIEPNAYIFSSDNFTKKKKSAKNDCNTLWYDVY